VLRVRQFLARALKRRVDAASQFSNATFIDIETDRRILFPELDGERETDIAKTDDADAQVIQIR
jgi:hypothetical protein